MLQRPAGVAEAERRAAAAGFGYSCEPDAGRLLAALSAAVPPGGRILELGTGAGVGAAWIVHGVGERGDVTAVSVELDPATAAVAAAGAWPGWLRFEVGDAEALLPGLGAFDLIFADAPGGKWSGLERTIAALAAGGVLLLDDMDPGRYPQAEHREIVSGITRTVLTHPGLVATAINTGSGFLLATRR
ncbi:O-methyltransferase [Dactylosporangium sp. CA-092794]|uniref:O-methyltransferase n=1 Tax=Dactylosporangium sp. CA-092794 TaxID=3239929 RepID=UPI003D8F1E98